MRKLLAVILIVFGLAAAIYSTGTGTLSVSCSICDKTLPITYAGTGYPTNGIVRLYEQCDCLIPVLGRNWTTIGAGAVDANGNFTFVHLFDSYPSGDYLVCAEVEKGHSGNWIRNACVNVTLQ